MTQDYVPVRLENDGRVYIEITRAGQGGDQAPSNVSILSNLHLHDVTEAVEALSDMMLTAIRKAKPTRASIDFGFEVGVDGGQLIAILVKGSSKANISVHVEWEAQQHVGSIKEDIPMKDFAK